MLTVNVICVGKLKEKFYLAAVEEYSKRLSRSCKLNLHGAARSSGLAGSARPTRRSTPRCAKEFRA